MPATSDRTHHAAKRLDDAAIACATMLSVACLARGAVYDSVIALLLLACLPILWMAMASQRPVHHALKTVGILFLAGMALVLCLQQIMPAAAGCGPVWQQVQSITGTDVTPMLLCDKAAWLQSIGRLLFFVLTFIIALFVGASESSSRLFLQALLVTGTICIAATFFVTTIDGIPTTTHYSYSHGFINANNASAYLGIMLILALAQAVRFFKFPSKTLRKALLDSIDQLNFRTVLHACFLLFTVLLSLAGLFMTGSRGGIFVSLLCCAVFSFMVMQKLNLRTRLRKAMIVSTVLAMVGILVWSFSNFGQVTVAKLQTDGVSANSRFDIFAAVLPMIGDHPWLGTGLGSFPGAFQPYRPANVSADGIIDKAHNSYLEFAAEMGLPALLMLMVALAWMGWQLYRSTREREERYITPLLGLSVWLLVALYSLIDFPLQIPGIAALCIALATVCVSQTDARFCQSSTTASPPIKRRRIRKRRNPPPQPINEAMDSL